MHEAGEDPRTGALTNLRHILQVRGSRQQHPATQVDDLGVRTARVSQVVSDGQDPAAADGQSGRPGPGGTRGQDRSSDEEQVGSGVAHPAFPLRRRQALRASRRTSFGGGSATVTQPAAEGHQTEPFGYLLKDRVLRVAEFLDALTRVAAGGSALDPEVVAAVLRSRGSVLAGLSAREREVLALAAEGFSNRAIAARLVVTDRTVETHMRSIFQKLRIPESDTSHRRVLAVLAYLRSPG